MHTRSKKSNSLSLLLITASAALLLNGCGGDRGSTGAAGPAAPAAAAVPVTSVAAMTTAQWAALAPAVDPASVSVSVNSAPVVTFKVTDANGTPVVGLGNTSKSATATVSTLTNIAFTLAKLVPGISGAPSKWVSYLVTTAPTTTAAAGGTYPTSDREGTLVDNGDGTYQYTFYRDITMAKDAVAALVDSGNNHKADLGDVTYEPNLTHRLGIQIGGNARGTGSNTADAKTVVPGVPMVAPANFIYDFVPATGKAVASTDAVREIVKIDSCGDCHARKVLAHSSRKDPRYCVTCHTEQIKYSFAPVKLDSTGAKTFTGNTDSTVNGFAIGNFPNFIHKIHMGNELTKTGYNFIGSVQFNDIRFPQDIRNCTKCHDNSATAAHPTPQGDNWKNAPSRLACGGCHDGIDFTTGAGVTLANAAADIAAGKAVGTTATGHEGHARPDDSKCALCHTPDQIPLYHIPVTPPNSGSILDVSFAAGGNANTNAAWIASNSSNLPAGAIKVSYDIKSVSVNSTGNPVMVFRLLQNGARADFNGTTGNTEIWPNFMGAPSVYFVFAVPQDGIAAPADFNKSSNAYIKTLWSKGCTTGATDNTLCGPDSDGYYTATLGGTVIPTGGANKAVMVTGGIGYTYGLSGATAAQPLTQTNLADYPLRAGLNTSTKSWENPQGYKVGGLIVIAPDVQMVASGGYTGRRAIVEDARCNKCHLELGAFTGEAFHAGQRNDGTTCAWCHTPNQSSSGWSADSAYFIHAIHAADKRTSQFQWHASSTTDGFWSIGYPGILSNCEACHLPGTYDFSAAASAAAVPNRLYRTTGQNIYDGTAGTTLKTYSNPSGKTTCEIAGTTTTTPVLPATAVSVFALSPNADPTAAAAIKADSATNYGIGFSYNASATSTSYLCNQTTGAAIAVAKGTSYPADGTTLVHSPIATVCFACHDTSTDVAHFRGNGGSIYQTRTTALATAEQCLTCHGSGKVADIAAVHPKAPK